MSSRSSQHASRPTSSRRKFLVRLGEVGGVSAVYQAMLAMGLLIPDDAGAAQRKSQWQAWAQQLPAEHKPTVAVLGAGIAGLVVAWELKKAGFPFYLIEARDRPGGRSHTLRAGSVITETDSQQTCSFDAGEELYFNAGPARISHHHSNLLAYCHELQVPLQAFVNDNRAAWMHSESAFGGQRMRAREVIATLRGNIAELLAKAINQGALDADMSLDEQTAVLQVLRDFGDLSTSYHYLGSTRAGLTEGSGGLQPPQAVPELDWQALAQHDSLAFFSSFVEGIDQQATMLQPVGGMDRIAEALAEQMSGDLYTGVEVTAIRRTGERVRIEGRTATLQGSVEADYAIITIPPSVLRNIPNDFSLAAQSAIAQVQYANPTKIAFQSPRFWEREEQIYGGISWTDPDILQIWYPSGGFGQDQGVVVGSYLFGGSRATNFANLTPAQRIELALAEGEKVHPRYRDNLQRGISVAWSKVPYTLGGWSVSSPSTVLQNPDGPFLFAGDHLTYLRGWQEGAVISALNALSHLMTISATN